MTIPEIRQPTFARALRDLYDESRAARWYMLKWFLISCGLAWIMFISIMSDWPRILFIVALSLSAPAWFITLINALWYARINGNINSLVAYADKQAPAENNGTTDPGPSGDISDLFRYDTEHHIFIGKLQVQLDNRTFIPPYQLTWQQWNAIAHTLALHNWQWSRRNIIAAKIPRTEGTDYSAFIGLTAPGRIEATKFGDLTEELKRYRVVTKNGKGITEHGIKAICKLGKLQVIPSGG